MYIIETEIFKNFTELTRNFNNLEVKKKQTNFLTGNDEAVEKKPAS